MANQRSYTAGRFHMEIDGYNVGYLKDLKEPVAKAEIALNDTGPDNRVKKHVANFKWEGASATVGAGMGKGMYDWIKMSFDKGYAPKGGRIVSADFDYKSQSELSFEDALITYVETPTFDGSSKEGCYLKVGFEPERVRYLRGNNQPIRSEFGPKQKSWLASNFRVEGLWGLPLGLVSKVEPIKWEQKIVEDKVGTTWESTKHPAKLTVPNIKLSIGMADYHPWADFAHKWLIDGQRREEDEGTMDIAILGPERANPTELARLSFENVGIVSVTREEMKANAENIARFVVELYTEKINFNIDYYDR